MPNLKERVGQWPHRISVVVLLFFLFYVAEVVHRDKGSEENFFETVVTLFEGREAQEQELQAVLQEIIETADKENLQVVLKKLSVLDPEMTHRLLERVIESRKADPESFSGNDVIEVFIAFASHPDVEDYLSENEWYREREFWFSMSARVSTKTGTSYINLSNKLYFSWALAGQPTTLTLNETSPAEIAAFFADDQEVTGGEVSINYNQLKTIPVDSPMGQEIVAYLQVRGIVPDTNSDFSLTRTDKTVFRTSPSRSADSREEVFSVLNTVDPRYQIRIIRRTEPTGSENSVSYFADISGGESTEPGLPAADASDFQTLENVWNATN